MDYMEVTFSLRDNSTGMDILPAYLSEIGYESFMEADENLKAYIPADLFQKDKLTELTDTLPSDLRFSFLVKTIKDQNWNEVWESNFEPVRIKDTVYVRAPFHKPDGKARYNIIIEPQMSFGTAHHETTSLLLELMLEENMTGKAVLDMGCGTGILAIFAEMLGASEIAAIDNDEWAYRNSLENVVKNKCKKISVHLGDAEILGNMRFDIILANINRNVIINDMAEYAKHLKTGGAILFSGFYSEDLPLVEISAKNSGLTAVKVSTKNNWIAVRFVKSEK